MLAVTYLDAIGWSGLQAVLGPAMPTGAGVPVAQVEHREQNINGYAPDTTKADFAGKAIVIESGTSVVSQHATRVGQHLYGSLAGVSPGVTQIDSWEVNDWSNRLLLAGTTLPPAVETQKIENHSWNSGSGPTVLEILRRFDYVINRDNIFAAVAVGNQGTEHVPNLLSSSYNAVTVGLSNGAANRGQTSFDGSGRIKPDIVAPEATTSQATPQVSGAAALLIDQSGRMAWSADSKTDAQASETLKAILLAGATKGQFPLWSRSPQHPLDQTYGSGQLNVYNSYDVLVAGEQHAGSVGLRGWDLAQTATAGGSQNYTFTIPPNITVGEMSIALTWNRTITSTLAGGFGNLQSSLANLDMVLSRVSEQTLTPLDSSLSTVDNVEYLYLRNLTPGTYQIAVTSATPDVSYALAWESLSTPTTTSLTSSLTTPTPGQEVTFTATVVTANGSAPSGTVSFFDGAILLGSSTMSAVNGQLQSSFTTSSLAQGVHSITAVYAGEGNFVSSTSNSVIETVGQVVASTTTALSANTTSAVVGQSLTFTATVSSGTGTPTGNVTFKDGGVVLVTIALSSGQATLSTSSLAVGSHSITAEYSGSASFATSTSSAVAASISKASTTSSLIVNANPASFGQLVMFTATIRSVAPGAGSPTGTVTFKKGTQVLGTAPVSGGQAVFTSDLLGVGNYSITAAYAGDGSFNSSTSAALAFSVVKSATITSITSDVNPVLVGQTVTFTAFVTAQFTGGGTPTGTVTFKDGNTVLGTATLVNGTATFATSGLSAGNHNITAVYGGSARHTTSRSTAITQTVSATSTTTALSVNTTSAVVGQSLTFTALVSSGAGTPTGSVTFKDGSVVLGTSALSSGQATLSTSSLAVGNHSITAVYSGAAGFATSTSSAVAASISKVTTTSSVIANANPAGFGQLVAFTATIGSGAMGSGSPTGTVTFKKGAQVLGTVPVSGGQAVFTSDLLGVGNYSITVTYAGDARFNSSISAALAFSVVKSATSTSVASDVNPLLVGQTVTFTAFVSAQFSGGGTPTGTVTFKDGNTVLGTATLVNGTATFATSSLSAGNHNITAVYGGSARHTTSRSTALTQTVNASLAASLAEPVDRNNSKSGLRFGWKWLGG